MAREIAYSVDRQFRLVEDNFWFRVERRNCLGWRDVRHRSRDRDLATRVLDSETRLLAEIAAVDCQGCL